jgi:hypothetical protein
VVREADRRQHLDGAIVRVARREPEVLLQPQGDVLDDGERVEQIVELKDEADLTADRDEPVLVRASQLAPEHREAALLRRAERAHEREQRRFSRARRAGQDHDLSGGHLGRHLEEDLLAELARSESVRHLVDGDQRVRHQNTSAGSAARSFRIAISADTQHMTSVSTSTSPARTGSITIGSMVACWVSA